MNKESLFSAPALTTTAFALDLPIPTGGYDQYWENGVIAPRSEHLTSTGAILPIYFGKPICAVRSRHFCGGG